MEWEFLLGRPENIILEGLPDVLVIEYKQFRRLDLLAAGICCPAIGVYGLYALFVCFFSPSSRMFFFDLWWGYSMGLSCLFIWAGMGTSFMMCQYWRLRRVTLSTHDKLFKIENIQHPLYVWGKYFDFDKFTRGDPLFTDVQLPLERVLEGRVVSTSFSGSVLEAGQKGSHHKPIVVYREAAADGEGEEDTARLMGGPEAPQEQSVDIIPFYRSSALSPEIENQIVAEVNSFLNAYRLKDAPGSNEQALPWSDIE